MGREAGSITVFLSLAGILVFALLGTLIETARYTVCGNHVSRTLQMASESLLTEYSRPLYEQYGLFFIESEGTPYERVIADYAGDTVEAAGAGDKDFLAGRLTDLEVVQKTYLGDDGAAALQKEITDYMKRAAVKEEMDKLRGDFSQWEDLEGEAEKIEQTVKREQEEARLDCKLLEFMKLVDGISVSNGKITCSGDFVKCFATKEKKGPYFSVTESAVWDKMSKKIDMRTRTWKIKNKSEFIAKLERVKAVTEQAIRKGNELQAAYSGALSPHESGQSHLSRILAARSCLETNKGILEKTIAMLGSRTVPECREELVRLWRDYDTVSLVFDYTGVRERGGAENPRDSLSKAWSGGLLQLVCRDGEKLPDKAVSDSFAEFYGQGGEENDYADRIGGFIDKDKAHLTADLGNIGAFAMDEFCLDRYIQKKFGSYVEKADGWDQALDYGIEYIAAGKRSDRENLASVLHRILLLRTVANFAAVSGDAAKKAQAEAAALAVVGFTGLQPLVALTKTLILLTWAIVESLVDIAALLRQKHVPAIKKGSEVTTEFPDLFRIDRASITGRASRLRDEGKDSFGYKKYLRLFLASVSRSKRLYRVMDLIQYNMRQNGYPQFQLGTCVYRIKVKGTMSFPSRFFRAAVLEKILGRSLQDYAITKEIEAGY